MRPGYVGSFEGEAYVVDQVASPPNVEFASFGGFALVCAGLGLVIAAVAYLRGLAGIGALLWVIACAGAAAFAVYTFGGWSAGFGTPDPHTAQGSFTFVPPLSPGVGWLAGPFVAALMFYALTLVDELRGRDAAEPATG
ncbi:hypothetical protein [Corynebacterium mycetoides]|nr:hypothetical protein [Corynebacterium mycetoides]